ncbi:hypothetical protein [Streptomyces sp. A 4/2]|uniref:hypothetical protein n=1 Tax=Streptomyces sp. A 4/2 TaxID=2934314 RepID=UPI002023D876|nr:hypothetical protein [Streptomyces sp. A 4/2]
MATEPTLSRGEPCIGCGVQVGEEHSAGCRETHCPQTGLPQAICPGRHGHSGGGVWTGLVPGEEAAVSFGWFAALRPGEGWVPVAPRPDAVDYGPEYMPDLNRVFSQARWRPSAQKWVRLRPPGS